MSSARAATDMRVLCLLPTARDARLSAELLGRNGIHACLCDSDEALTSEIRQGVGAVLLAEETLVNGGHAVLREAIRDQPRWSDLPVLLLTHSGPSSLAVDEAVGTLGNVTLMERPLRVAALVSTVRAALRARTRQYQIQSHLMELERARETELGHARRKDELLAMLGHELRNPLAPIRNALEILELDDRDPARRAELRRMMLRQIEHMVRLVDDLLEASRLSQGKIALQKRPVDLRGVLGDAVEPLRRPADGKRAATVVLDLPDTALALDADPVRLAQVFGNLLNNALRYGRPGGTIEVTARARDGMAEVSVRDDGVGIEADVLPHVFELFTQGRRDEHRLHDGLGVGLALVKQLVGMHGGEVEAQSDGKGKGARFLVRLPLAAAAATPRDAANQPTHVAARRLRILVVDDNEDAADSLTMLLETLGHELATAHDGAGALDLAAGFHPDVALLDVGMPGMDGYELARRLRADPAQQGLLLAAMTGWGEERDRERAREAGFDHHFRKPADIKALTRMLAGVASRAA